MDIERKKLFKKSCHLFSSFMRQNAYVDFFFYNIQIIYGRAIKLIKTCDLYVCMKGMYTSFPEYFFYPQLINTRSIILFGFYLFVPSAAFSHFVRARPSAGKNRRIINFINNNDL